MPIVFFYFIGTVTGGFGGQRPASARCRSPCGRRPTRGVVVERARAAARGAELRRRAAGHRRGVPSVRAGGSSIPSVTTASASVTEAVLAGNSSDVTFERRGDDLAGGSLDRGAHRPRASTPCVADLAVIAEPPASEPTPRGVRRARGGAAPRDADRASRPGADRTPPSGFAQAMPGTMVMFTMIVLAHERRDHARRRARAGAAAAAGLGADLARRRSCSASGAARLALALVQIGVRDGRRPRAVRRWTGGRIVPMVLAGPRWLGRRSTRRSALLLGSLDAHRAGRPSASACSSSMFLAALGGCWWPIEITPPLDAGPRSVLADRLDDGRDAQAR